MRDLLSKLTLSYWVVCQVAAVLIAIGLISTGVALIFFPAGFIVAGLLVILSLIDSRR